jgi:phage-related protein
VKPLVWLGDSLDRLREFPREARRNPAISSSACSELRVRMRGSFRVIYVAKFSEAAYVLHAFAKKSRKTDRTDIDLARKRFADLIRERKS